MVPGARASGALVAPFPLFRVHLGDTPDTVELPKRPSMVPWIPTFVTYYVTNATKRLMAKGKSEPKGGLPPAPNRLGSLISGLSLRASPLRCFVDLHETNTGGIPYAADLGGVNARLKFHQ